MLTHLRRFTQQTHSRRFSSVRMVSSRTRVLNLAVAACCSGFIGSVYYFSVTKMKEVIDRFSKRTNSAISLTSSNPSIISIIFCIHETGDNISDEIELHEANLTAARKVSATQVIFQNEFVFITTLMLLCA